MLNLADIPYTGSQAPKNRKYIFTVRGRTEFPLDMLRYDCAYPASSETCAGMYRTLVGPYLDVATPRNYVDIRLVSSHITPARWKSFGWEVTELDYY